MLPKRSRSLKFLMLQSISISWRMRSFKSWMRKISKTLSWLWVCSNKFLRAKSIFWNSKKNLLKKLKFKSEESKILWSLRSNQRPIKSKGCSMIQKLLAEFQIKIKPIHKLKLSKNPKKRDHYLKPVTSIFHTDTLMICH